MEETIKIPIWTNWPVLNTTTQDVQPKAKTPDVHQTEESHQPPEMDWEQDADGPQDEGGPGTMRYSGVSKIIMHTETNRYGLAQIQQYYLQEFVDRVHPMLEALLSCEALPASLSCVQCATGSAARCRCKDCTMPRLMCRCCMQETHRDNPLHRVERWTGRFFRAAELWEVGVYMLIPHYSGKDICPTLK